MSSRYKFRDQKAVYFTTSTIAGWVDIFTRDIYRDIVIDSLKFCQKNQGLVIHAWVLMTNHLHMICSFKNETTGNQILRNFKSFTAMKLIDAILNNKHESRKESLLNTFEREGLKTTGNHKFKVWVHENHPVLLDSSLIYDQKLIYIHENPVRAGHVNEPFHWRYSSAIDYYSKNEKGLLEIVFLD